MLFLHSSNPPDAEQRDAWSAEVELLKQLIPNQTGHLLLEFNIPRMGLRADAVLLLPACVVILEFKLGEQHATPAARSRVCCLSTAELILDEARKVGFDIPAALNWTA